MLNYIVDYTKVTSKCVEELSKLNQNFEVWTSNKNPQFINAGGFINMKMRLCIARALVDNADSFELDAR